MLSYAWLGITIVFFFLQHICPCISELLESSSEGRNCVILSYIFFIMHLSTLIFFFRMWSQYRYHTLKLPHFSCVVFSSSSSRGHSCLTGVSLRILFELWSQSYTHTPHLSPMYWAQWLPAGRWLPSASWGLCSLRLPGLPGFFISYDPELLRVSLPSNVLCESDCLWSDTHYFTWLLGLHRHVQLWSSWLYCLRKKF